MIKRRLAARHWNEPLEYAYWAETLEMELCRRLTLNEIEALSAELFDLNMAESGSDWLEIYQEVI